jgi:hypothetical protein
VYEARSDADGLYEFYNLPSGKYELAPELPPNKTFSRYMRGDKPHPPIELTGGRCKEYDIHLFASGSIEGRVFSASNNPISPDARVYIIPSDQKVLPKRFEMHSEAQEMNGHFRFLHLPPGNYLILVNPDDKRRADFPHERTFYPGVRDRASAGIITIRGGEQIKDANIRLAP